MGAMCEGYRDRLAEFITRINSLWAERAVAHLAQRRPVRNCLRLLSAPFAGRVPSHIRVAITDGPHRPCHARDRGVRMLAVLLDQPGGTPPPAVPAQHDGHAAADLFRSRVLAGLQVAGEQRFDVDLLHDQVLHRIPLRAVLFMLTLSSPFPLIGHVYPGGWTHAGHSSSTGSFRKPGCPRGGPPDQRT